MNTLSIKNIRQHFSDVIRSAESGETTVITKYGKPVAKVIPIEKDTPKFPDMTEFRNSIKSRGKTLTETLMDMREEERY